MANHRIEVTLSVLAEIPALVRARRAELGVSLRVAEELSGVPFNVITRCEREDGGLALDTAVMLLRWVGESRTVCPPDLGT